MLSLSSPDIEAQFGVSALETDGLLDDMFLWPYRDNQAPQGQLEAPEVVEPGQTMTLDASGFLDADSDFVTYTWRHLSKPDGCKDVLPKNAPVVELPDACRGIHEVELVVSDGFNEVVRPFTVTVAGPLPQVEEVVALEREDDSEALSLQVEVHSAAEQRVAELFPEGTAPLADIDGDGADDILQLPSYGSVDQFTIEHYSDDSETLLETYTLNTPELDGIFGFRTRFVNLDDEPGDELVLATYDSDQLYLLKRAGTVFEGPGDLDGDGRVEVYSISPYGLYQLNSDTYEFKPIDRNRRRCPRAYCME